MKHDRPAGRALPIDLTPTPTYPPHHQAMGSEAVAIKADMSKPDEVEKLFKETAAAFSDPVSVLVRASAGFRLLGRVSVFVFVCVSVCSTPSPSLCVPP